VREPLDVGDQVLISVTHQVKIGREPAWVKVEMASKVREMETTKEIVNRISKSVNSEVIRVIESTVETVNKHVK